ncbi:MAG: hypothetical protein K0R98_2001 [Rickettsiaceae bacterium]|jgi:hypothetical protein|nr:hypothetical protein [Rickettsiaceae bacterium]
MSKDNGHLDPKINVYSLLNIPERELFDAHFLEMVEDFASTDSDFLCLALSKPCPAELEALFYSLHKKIMQFCKDDSIPQEEIEAVEEASRENAWTQRAITRNQALQFLEART